MNAKAPAASLRYIAAGGHRHPSAADWAPGLIAFGAGKNIALWNPEDARQNGIAALLAGHTDVVNVVRIHDLDGQRFIISGGADKTVRIWKPTKDDSSLAPYEQSCCLVEHQSSINTISVFPHLGLFVTGAADSTVKIWTLTEESGAKLIQSISLQPRYLPLCTALVPLAGGAIALAVAGTSSSVQLYVRPEASAEYVLQATLTGHEGWIRSLDFVQDGESVLLASASQDKYIRLWRLQREEATPVLTNGTSGTSEPAVIKKSLSNKAHQVGNPDAKYSVTFEALLIGHEDWIYTARWAPQSSTSKDPPTLLSASADNSLAIWTADEASGVWVCNARLGEFSAQKGSTTATGSTGGFWIGLWQPDGHSVVSLSRTGSWRRWVFDVARETWEQRVGISGHTQEVQGLAWAPDGSYLLTTGSDQTTRLFAEWKREGLQSWHEFARPQIHGYDLNCIDTISNNQFISGADEKLLRVFNKPRALDTLLSTLSGTQPTVDGLAETANIPVLGLSNKAVPVTPNDDDNDGDEQKLTTNTTDGEPRSTNPTSTTPLPTQPPHEDHLARQTLWPEHEKLYGHGHEISAVACSPDGKLVATACKASSVEHAVIRLYETRGWREVRPALSAHGLTVIGLAFSSGGEEGQGGRSLVSVGRDRRWTVFQRDEEGSGQFKPVAWREKAHARMILGCAWAPPPPPPSTTIGVGHVFATAGRDKCVKIWKVAGGSGECMLSVPLAATGTAVAFSSIVREGRLRLAVGTEDGGILVLTVEVSGEPAFRAWPVARALCPSGSVSCLRWRPGSRGEGVEGEELAVGSEDHSVRILEVRE
ncbi:hypothetical protein B0A55_09032 [Friedmanniomyces simplex]|uniref:Elongator complex protein 2 n=1 Tax=Friedmanniomyces simplex TaxID=329884 RepID=A0A4U0WTN7_9PEZI|nr:hypothetical protein B0A55_09032 [Friedmanniomyces simplex]